MAERPAGCSGGASVCLPLFGHSGLIRNFWILAIFCDTIFPRRANNYIGTAGRPGLIPQRRQSLMHSATSVVRAIYHCTSQARRRAQRPAGEPPLPPFADGREPPFPPFADGGPPLLPLRDGRRPPLQPFGDGGPPLLPFGNGHGGRYLSTVLRCAVPNRFDATRDGRSKKAAGLWSHNRHDRRLGRAAGDVSLAVSACVPAAFKFLSR